jgi:hypothetical protein
VRQIHLLWRDRGSCTGPMAYSELSGMMSKALEQLQLFKSKVGSRLWLHQHVAAPEHTGNATEHVSPACV